MQGSGVWRMCLVLLGMAAVTKGFPQDGVGCVMGKSLRDKWVFVDRWTKNFVRIRRNAFIYFDKEIGVKHRYTCVETRGNIYLLADDRLESDSKRVLCVGFTYIGYRKYVEYAILRLNSNDKTDLVAPRTVPANTTVSIDKTCDLLQNQRVRKAYAFVRRVGPGCKFPRDLRIAWQCTDMTSLKVTFNTSHMTYKLTNGNDVSMTCEKRDASVFLLRISNFRTRGKDAILCLRVTPLPDNRDYDYELLRLNSGTEFEGKLKLVPSSREVYIHLICDWIDSPARPEYLYV